MSKVIWDYNLNCCNTDKYTAKSYQKLIQYKIDLRDHYVNLMDKKDFKEKNNNKCSYISSPRSTRSTSDYEPTQTNSSNLRKLINEKKKKKKKSWRKKKSTNNDIINNDIPTNDIPNNDIPSNVSLNNDIQSNDIITNYIPSNVLLNNDIQNNDIITNDIITNDIITNDIITNDIPSNVSLNDILNNVSLNNNIINKILIYQYNQEKEELFYNDEEPVIEEYIKKDNSIINHDDLF